MNKYLILFPLGHTPAMTTFVAEDPIAASQQAAKRFPDVQKFWVCRQVLEYVRDTPHVTSREEE